LNAFFNFFRSRLNVAGSLPAGPDQHILVAACLDALAKYWASAFQQKFVSHQHRMAEFLALHGGHPALQRVATPYFERWVRHNRPTTSIGHWLPQPTALVVTWEKDPTIDVLQQRLLPHSLPPDWFQRWRYGGVIYKEHRCGWIHDAQAGDAPDTSFSSYSDTDTPHYAAFNNKRILVLTSSFLMKMLEHAIASFEETCRLSGKNPI
jgi:hypothetical protein